MYHNKINNNSNATNVCAQFIDLFIYCECFLDDGDEVNNMDGWTSRLLGPPSILPPLAPEAPSQISS